MPEKQRFDYSPGDASRYEASLLPRLPLTLTYGGKSMNVYGLLDTGSTVNVLPYPVGIELGVRWEDEPTSIRLAGNLAKLGARPLLLNALVGTFQQVELAFAWTSAENVPVILGQYNFFEQFDACFFRGEMAFELELKNLAGR